MNDFDTMLRILRARIAEQAELIEHLSDCANEQQATIDSLTAANDRYVSDLATVTSERNRYERLYKDVEAEVQNLRTDLFNVRGELNKYRFNDPEVCQKAAAWMAEHHREYILTEGMSAGKYNTIGMIKEVRLLMCWGLKESKDFVDHWLEKNAA